MTITLVHGTFSSPQALAGLAKTLRERFPDAAITDDFNWSGFNNSSPKRLGAAERLAASLRAQPGPHLLIGHSHGGFVALRAARGLANVAGVVTLNTPFLSVHARQPMFQALVGIAMGGWIHFSSPWLFGNLPKGVSQVHRAVVDYTNSVDLMFGLLFLVSGLLVLFLQRIWVKGKNRALALLEQLDDRHTEHVRMLVIRRPGDEASGLLGGVYTLAWVLHRVVQVLLWIPAAIWAFYVVALFGLLAVNPVWSVDPDTNPIVKLIEFFEEDAPLPMVMAVAVLLFGGSALTQGVAFGPEFMWLHPWIYCSVDPVPTGRHEIENLRETDGDGSTGLFHSRIYCDRRVVDAVSTWIMADANPTGGRSREASVEIEPSPSRVL